LFPKTEEEEIIPNKIYKSRITLLWDTNKDETIKKESYMQIFLIN
jgi:hypothetical protein